MEIDSCVSQAAGFCVRRLPLAQAFSTSEIIRTHSNEENRKCLESNAEPNVAPSARSYSATLRGFFLTKGKLYRSAREAVNRSLRYSYRDRRNRKRDFRTLWIQRIGAAARNNGLSYSQLIHGLKVGGIDLDRKILADMAVNDAAGFTSLVESAKSHLATAETGEILAAVVGRGSSETLPIFGARPSRHFPVLRHDRSRKNCSTIRSAWGVFGVGHRLAHRRVALARGRRIRTDLRYRFARILPREMVRAAAMAFARALPKIGSSPRHPNTRKRSAPG